MSYAPVILPRRSWRVGGLSDDTTSGAFMKLPFTPEQFFGLFADYNHAFWPIAAGLWIASALALTAVVRNPARGRRAWTSLLAILWAWSALAYHATLFTRINPAAWLFAALFGVQAALLFLAAVRNELAYFSSPGPMRALGLGLAAYALAYPFLNMAFGHPYPETPTFGVPCPTAILTIGSLVAARGRLPRALDVIPALWGIVGGSAAVILGVWPDYVLLAAGLMLTVHLLLSRSSTAASPPLS